MNELDTLIDCEYIIENIKEILNLKQMSYMQFIDLRDFFKGINDSIAQAFNDNNNSNDCTKAYQNGYDDGYDDGYDEGCSITVERNKQAFRETLLSLLEEI